jgi:hypothetical protein
MSMCPHCKNKGYIDLGNRDVPCECLAGDRIAWNHPEAGGPVTGAEVKRYFRSLSREEVPKYRCHLCNDTGTIETGNNDLPCKCPAGDTAQFNICEVVGLVTGAEVKRHFLNFSPDPIEVGMHGMKAEDLPGRKKKN